MRPANRREWAKVQELLDDVHAMHPDLTIGEVVHVASVLGDGESPWGACAGAVTRGLELMLEMPRGTRWGPTGIGMTWDPACTVCTQPASKCRCGPDVGPDT